MTTVVELEVHATETALGQVFEAIPELACEMEPVIASEGYGLWFSAPDQSVLESALGDDPSVRAHSTISAGPDRWLYDVTFTSDVVDVFELILEECGTVLTAAASDGRWHIRGRFLEREAASRLYQRLEREGSEPTLVRLTQLRDGQATAERLTPKQYETLLTAFDHGYFTIPRETSMEELADELGVSHQALSERFRRAYRALVMTELNGARAPQRPEDKLTV